MKKLSVLWLIVLAALTSCTSENKTQSSQKVNFNLDWHFHLSQEDISFDKITDTDYEQVNLPHDWVIKGEFDKTLGKDALATGFIRSKGYGYYVKEFDLPKNNDELIYVLFDGVYNNATVSINGTKLGFHPYGYSPFYYEISKYLNDSGKSNKLRVKIDHSRYADSRWYTGAGIYREVSLIQDKKIHVPVWGTFITTPTVSKEKATVSLELDVENKFDSHHNVVVKTSFVNAKGEEVTSSENKLSVKGNTTQKIHQKVTINHPNLWSVDTPNLYKAITVITEGDKTVDTYETTFGIRSIRFDADKGFFLNEENMKIKGVCLHHDVGLVGTAVPKDVWKRRLLILKEGGCNAIRVSHNPASKVLLELSDELGFLVQDEFFDEWDNPKDKRYNRWEEKSTDYITRGYGEHFQKWAEEDLRTTMLSHRNHPSIFQWSIGNEVEWTYKRNAKTTGFFDNMSWQGNYFWSKPPHSIQKIKHLMNTLPRGKYDIGKTAQKLSRWTKAIDTTRPVIANCILPSSSYESGYADALDIIGYSYRRVIYDYGHKNYPDLPVMGTENVAQYHEWKAIMERPFVSGTFLWTGADYMGEIRQAWPTRVQPSGMINTASFPKGSYYMMKSLWNEKPMIHIATQTIEKSLYKIEQGKLVEKKKDGWKHYLWRWQDVNEHWNYNTDENVVIEVYSNCDEIELFLNEKSLGKKKLSQFEDHIYKWLVPFKDGALTAKGFKNGVAVSEEIVTARKATKIRLTADRTMMKANHTDAIHLMVELLDDNGHTVKTDPREITLATNESLKLLGVDNGWKKSVEKFYSYTGTTHNGKTLFILQAKNIKKTATISVSGDGLASDTLEVQIQ